MAASSLSTTPTIIGAALTAIPLNFGQELPTSMAASTSFAGHEEFSASPVSKTHSNASILGMYVSTPAVEDDHGDKDVASGIMRIKNTFIHLDKEEVISDDDAPLPIKSVSAPNIQSDRPISCIGDTLVPEKLCLPSGERAPRDEARTPKVRFDDMPAFFGDGSLVEQICSGSKTDLETPKKFSSTDDFTSYVVKNTFIHVDASAELESDSDCMPPVRSVSGPAICAPMLSPAGTPAKVCLDSLQSELKPTDHSSSDGSAEPLKVDSGIVKVPMSPAASKRSVLPVGPRENLFPRMSLPASEAAVLAGHGTVKDPSIHMDERTAKNEFVLDMPVKNLSQPGLLVDPDSVTPELEVLPLPSVGAALHASGKCKPCAWFWKPASCQWGADCCHCHLCPEGELRRRKKEKLAVFRMESQRDWHELQSAPMIRADKIHG